MMLIHAREEAAGREWQEEWPVVPTPDPEMASGLRESVTGSTYLQGAQSYHLSAVATEHSVFWNLEWTTTV